MTNTTTAPLAHRYLNSACRLGFEMRDLNGHPILRFEGRHGAVALTVLDPEGAVRLHVLRREVPLSGAPFLVETGSVEVSCLSVPLFEAMLLGLLAEIDPV